MKRLAYLFAACCLWAVGCILVGFAVRVLFETAAVGWRLFDLVR